MGDQLKRVNPGDDLKIPAALINTVVELRDLAKRLHDAGANVRDDQRRASIVKIKNNSGAAVGAFNVLGVDTSVVITPTANLTGFKSDPVLKGISPVSPDHVGGFVITIESIADGAIGLAMRSGIVPVKIQVDSDSKQQFADIRHGQTTKLIARYSGAAAIIWKESGTGDKWGLVHLGPLVQQSFQGSLASTLSSTSAATLAVYAHSTAGSWSTAGYNVTSYAPLMLASGKTLASGTKVLARGDRISGLLVVEGSGDCPE